MNTTFYENFLFLCRRNGKSKTTAMSEIGLAKSLVYRWQDGSIPNNESLYKIANYFNVNEEDLFDVDLQFTFDDVKEQKKEIDESELMRMECVRRIVNADKYTLNTLWDVISRF